MEFSQDSSEESYRNFARGITFRVSPGILLEQFSAIPPSVHPGISPGALPAIALRNFEEELLQFFLQKFIVNFCLELCLGILQKFLPGKYAEGLLPGCLSEFVPGCLTISFK